MNNHILPFSCQASVKLYLLKHSCKEMAITREIKRNCLDGIHSNVLSLSHQILFYIIATLITIKYLELEQSIEYFRFSSFVPDTCNPKNELKGKFHHKL